METSIDLSPRIESKAFFFLSYQLISMRSRVACCLHIFGEKLESNSLQYVF